MTTENKSALLPAILTFVVVAGGIFVAGIAATWILRNVVLPAAALILGFLAARVVYKVRD